MGELEEKLSAILNDPEAMGRIMSMAQALGSQEPPREAPPEPPREQKPSVSMPDMAMLQKVSGLARGSSIDKEQQTLLKALHPYLSSRRLRKLENAMRAAKMARLAAIALGAQGGKIPSGR